MRKCLYKFCNKDINYKRKNALYCDIDCLNKNRRLKIYIDATRWVNISTSSSYEAMLDIYKLFKAQSQRHRQV